MSINTGVPDYDLVDEVVVSSPPQLRAMANPLRSTILDLLLERAATVSELAEALHRPKSTVAHHVNVLADAGLLHVVRTRRVRAIDERFYGRTARLFRVGALGHSVTPASLGDYSLATAAAEGAIAHEADELRGTLRHARIPRERAEEFWERVVPLIHEFAQLPRSGDTVYGFVVGLYPADRPTLPEPGENSRSGNEDVTTVRPPAGAPRRANPDARSMSLAEDTNRRMLRARDAMDRAYASPLDIPALARIAVVSEGHFIRTFRAVFGETPHRYLQRRRVERAMFLLRSTDRPVTDICFETGFGSLGTFSRTFAAIVGESPTAYRRRGVVHPVPSCFAMAWTRPSTFNQPQASSSGEAPARPDSVPSPP